jgi:type VI secretion system protein
MAREQAFLDRLASLDSGSGDRFVSAEQDEEKLMSAVGANLQRVLNARHHMCQAQPDYGLPAMTDLPPSRELAERILQTAIRKAVEQFEPRLSRARVTLLKHDHDRQVMQFEIQGVLATNRGDLKVWYRTHMRSSGVFDVSG